MKKCFLSAFICLLAGHAISQDAGSAPKIEQIEAGLIPALRLEGQPPAVYRLDARMQHYKVPALSIAFINNGKIEWAKAYGYLGRDGQVKADTLTLFQAASISKPITATLAFKLAAQGKLTLDEDVNKGLSSWKLKPSPFTAEKPVTLSGLLANTAGLSVEGFHGYPQGSPLPTTVQILNGEAPANSPSVVSIAAPGTGYRHSGGGYVVVKQLIEDVNGQSFIDLIKQQVLIPAGMLHSTFEQPLPEPLHANAAAGHNVNGETLPGKWNTMAEIAPDGLWTTPADLARYLLDMSRAFKGQSSGILPSGLVNQMVSSPENRGVWSNPDDPNGWYFTGHNDGYCAEMIMFPGKGQGIVVMANGDYGSRLIREIIRGAARAYQGNGFEPVTRSVAKLDDKTLQSYAGRYVLEGTPLFVDISVQADHLLAKLSLDGSQSTVYPASKERFFSREDETEVTFLLGSDGVVTGLNAMGRNLSKAK